MKFRIVASKDLTPVNLTARNYTNGTTASAIGAGDQYTTKEIQEQVAFLEANNTSDPEISPYKRIRQIGVELAWLASRLKVTGDVAAEERRLEDYSKELKEILMSLGVPEGELYADGFSPNIPSLQKQRDDDAEKLVQDLRAGSSIDILHRTQLVAVAWHLGCQESDTRGQPVRALRALITAKLTVEPVAPRKTFKLPRLMR
jgi:hypothetical protein